MIKKRISDIVEEAAAAAKKADKINILRKNDGIALRTYLKMMIDKKLKWLIPEGTPPFNPCKELDVEFVLYNELRRMYIFLPGGNPNLTSAKKERLFITMLESMSPKDAQFLIDVKDHKIPPGLTAKIIKEAFPGV